MLEVMSAGTPVAAYPVDGPLEVLGAGGSADGRRDGGVLHEDLQRAYYGALAVPRAEARSRALDFSSAHAAALFESCLVRTNCPEASMNLDAHQGVTAPGSVK